MLLSRKMDYTLIATTENKTVRYLLCDKEQNYYVISRLLHDILFEYKITKSSREICEKLNMNRKEALFTEAFVEQSLEKAEEIMLKPHTKAMPSKKYIKHKIKIIKEGQLQNTYKLLSLLFNKYIFIFVALISIVINIQFFYQNGFTNLHMLYDRLIDSSSISNSVLFILLFFIIALIHEVGHATATYKYKIRPKEIGIGLYFIFPVFYTNVTNAWSLPVLKRMVVNLGGIYFQLIINCFLILLYRFNFFNNIACLLIVYNAISMLVSFNPFFRYDGYWLFSDFFGVCNLKEKSTAFITNIINYPNKAIFYVKNNKTKSATIIYSVLNLVFWVWVYVCIIKYFVKNIPDFYTILFLRNALTIKSVILLFNCLLILIGTYNGVKLFFMHILKSYHHAK